MFYNYGFPAGGLTIRLNISIGSIVCYASDIIESPNEVRGYDWKVEANGYIDVFLDPTSLGRPAGSVVYIALNGVQATNSFNLGSTAGDTSTTGSYIIMYHIKQVLGLVCGYYCVAVTAICILLTK